MTRVWATILGCAGVMIAADVALAAGAGQVDRPSDAGGLLREIAHKHTHLNGHALLGDKIKHDGKHALGKLSGRTVTADVKGGKVVNMAAGDLPVTRVKSAKQMATFETGLTRVAWTLPLQLAQYDQTYYGYCVDDGVSYTCYWYPASDVVYQDYTWVPYDPTY